jgi:hypothetical protein
MTTFRDQYLDLQYLIKNMIDLRQYNDQQAQSGNNHNCLLFAEAATLCVAFERFLRVLPAIKAKQGETLSNFIERALPAKKKPLFKSPYPNIPNTRIVKVVRDIRNGILHGLYEELAAEYKHKGVSNTTDYFSGGYFTQDMQIIFEVFNSFISQVDATTGKII